MGKKTWEDWELQVLRDYWGKLSIEEIAELLPSKTEGAVDTTAFRLGLKSKRRFWTDEEEQILRDNFLRLGVKGVAKLLPNRAASMVHLKAIKLGLAPEINCWAEIEDQILRDNSSQRTAEQIAKLLPGRTARAVRQRIRKLGIAGERWACKHSANRHFFENPTILNSYWAGFIAADGCVSWQKDSPTKIFHITVTESDRCLLERFVRDVEFTGSIRVSKARISKGRDIVAQTNRAASVQITCAQEWFPDLERHFNITPRKSLTLKPPSGLDRECSLAYIKGYFDGDGCVHFTKRGYMTILFYGTEEVLSWIKSICDEIAPHIPNGDRITNRHLARVVQDGTICRYQIGEHRAKGLAREILKLDIPGLSRKWDKIQERLAEEARRAASISNPVQMYIRDPSKMYLGRLCARGHDYEGTGRTLRRKSDNHCLKCCRDREGCGDPKKSKNYWFEKTLSLRPELNGTPFYLGVLCLRGHNHEDLGYSLRRRNDGNCVMCDKCRKRSKR